MSSSFWWLFLHLVLLFSFLSPFCPKSDSPPSDGMVSHLPASISFEFHVSLNIISRLIMNNESDFINSRTSSSFLKKWRPLLEDSDPRRESACVSCPMGFLRCPFSVRTEPQQFQGRLKFVFMLDNKRATRQRRDSTVFIYKNRHINSVCWFRKNPACCAV